MILSDGEIAPYPICKKYSEDTKQISFLGALVQLASLLVVLTSFILRTFFIALIRCTGSPRHSNEASATMFSVLIVSFFNYGILYIIAPWNFLEAGV